MTQLVITIEDSSLAPSLKRVISSLRGVSSVTTISKKSTQMASLNKSKMNARLEELAALPKGWDDENALPIEQKVISNTKRLIESSDETVIGKWVLFPDVNGTIMLTSKNQKGNISIGCDSFSYAVETKKGLERKDSMKFSTRSLNRILKSIIE